MPSYLNNANLGKEFFSLGGVVLCCIVCIGSLEVGVRINTLHHKEQDDGHKALTEIVCLAVVYFCIKHGRKLFCCVCETLKIELSSFIFSILQLNSLYAANSEL
jgi:hypothetical protein